MLVYLLTPFVATSLTVTLSLCTLTPFLSTSDGDLHLLTPFVATSVTMTSTS